MPELGEQIIVSVTPMAVERDSRTFKQASSLARHGYRSVVVEGEASALSAEDLPFELSTIPDALRPWGSAGEPASPDAHVDDEAPARPGAAMAGTEPRPADAEVDPVRRAWRRWLRAKNRAVVRLRRVAYPLRWHLAWNRRAYKSLPDADLFILHGFSLAPAVLARATRTRARIAYDAHDAYFELDPEHPSRRGERLLDLLERVCVRRARGLMTVSHGLAQMLEERWGRFPEVIRNCHDLRLDRRGEELRDRLGLSEREFLLVSIGNAKPGMEVDSAVRAMAVLPPDVHLAFVGRGHERHHPLLEDHGLQARVHLVPSVAPTEVASFVRSADAAIVLYSALTRNYENALPNGFFQSLAAGLPVLYPAQLPEVAALAGRYELGIPIDPTSPQSISEAISELRQDVGQRGRMACNSAGAAKAESWENEEKVLASYVRSVLR